MKKIYLIVALAFMSSSLKAQLNGQLTITGSWNVTVPADVSIEEAGTNYQPIESASNQALVSWSTSTLLGVSTCELNYTNYTVFVSKENNAIELNDGNDFKIFVRRTNVGQDPTALLTPLLPKTPPFGGVSYLEAKANVATEFFRFQGCRENIPIQFKLDASVLTPVNSYYPDVVFTIVDESILAFLGL